MICDVSVASVKEQTLLKSKELKEKNEMEQVLEGGD